MFGTLLGGLPRPLDADGAPVDDDDRAVDLAIAAQLEAGLEPLTDGRLRAAEFADPVAGLGGVEIGTDGPRVTSMPAWVGPLTVAGWRFAVAHATGVVKQALPGPYTLGRRLGAADRDALGSAFAQAIRREIQALADAGCPFVEIDEPDAYLIGSDEAERRRFRDAHEELLEGIDGVHVSLAIVGGNADTAGSDTLLGAPYRSFAFDLIDGPDNWRVIRAVPGDRGVICGAVSAASGSDDGPELLLWASAYAASSNTRGLDRVGLSTSAGLGGLSWPAAVTKMRRLGHAASLAASPDEALARIDPRAVDIRSAALGRYAGPLPRPRGRRRRSPS